MTDLEVAAEPVVDPRVEWPWHMGPRERFVELTRRNRELTAQVARLEARLAGTKAILQEREHVDAYVRRVLRTLEGET